METKELKITTPDGYEIDKETSTFECIKFKKKGVLTYEEISRKLLSSDYYFINCDGEIEKGSCYPVCLNNAAFERQLQKLLAINMLMNVANYLNDGWKPNWMIIGRDKWYIQLHKNEIEITSTNNVDNYAIVYFKSEELAQKAIDILGEDTIRLALSTDW